MASTMVDRMDNQEREELRMGVAGRQAGNAVLTPSGLVVIPPKATHAYLAEISEALNRGFPPRPRRLYERVYSVITGFLRYVGLPAAILAAVVPVHNLAKEYFAYRNRDYMRRTYGRYAAELLESGEIDRANTVATWLEKIGEYDVQTQYTKTKIVTLMAIRQGRRHDEAEDMISILLRLNEDAGPLFPRLGAKNELVDLRLRLSDIHIQRTRYDKAEQVLSELDRHPEVVRDVLLSAEVALRRGQIAVLTFHLETAKNLLKGAVSALGAGGAAEALADAEFSLGKAYQFSNEFDEALGHYDTARQSYEKVHNRYGLLATYNNLAMILFDQNNHARARYFYELEQQIAREVGDELAVARTLVNLAMICRNEGRIEDALRLANEALGAFKSQGNKLGIAAALHNLANIQVRNGMEAEALHSESEALVVFQDLHDARGVAKAFGVLSLAARALKLDDEFYYLYASTLIDRHLGAEKSAEAARDQKIHLEQLRAILARQPPIALDRLASAKRRLSPVIGGLGLVNVDMDVDREPLTEPAPLGRRR
jgi:tetratricopeptide (TPR) repeat protein